MQICLVTLSFLQRNAANENNSAKNGAENKSILGKRVLQLFKYGHYYLSFINVISNPI